MVLLLYVLCQMNQSIKYDVLNIPSRKILMFSLLSTSFVGFLGKFCLFRRIWDSSSFPYGLLYAFVFKNVYHNCGNTHYIAFNYMATPYHEELKVM